MGFSLLQWKESGRDWSRGEPPPRGSVEYAGLPDVFQPPPRASSSGNVPPPPRPAAPPPPPTPRPAPPPEAATPKSGRGSGVAWLLGAAGAAYLASRLLDRRSPASEDSEGDVVVLRPGDHAVVGGDEGQGEVYDGTGEEESEET